MPTIRLRTRAFVQECLKRDWFSASAQARGLGMSPSSMWRVLENESAPSAGFIASVLTVFPEVSFADMFEVVEAPTDAADEVVEEMSA